VPGTDSFVTTFTEAKTFIDGRAMENPSFHGGSFISVIVVISLTRHLSSFRFLRLVLQVLLFLYARFNEPIFTTLLGVVGLGVTLCRITCSMLDLSFPCPMRRLLTVVRGEAFAFSGVSYCDPRPLCVYAAGSG